MKENYIKISIRTVKTIIIAVFTGLICGAVGILLHHAVDIATEMRGENRVFLYLLPLFGVVIAWLYHTFNPADKGTDGIFAGARNGEKLPIAIAPLIFIGTVLTHLGGGSSGREGAALQLGGSIGSNIAYALKVPDEEKNGIILAGMCAVFSAMFGTPITAFVFVMEVITVGNMYYFAVLPCIVSSLTAFSLALFTGATPMGYQIATMPDSFDFVLGVKVAVLSCLCAGVSYIFCHAMHTAHHLYAHYFKNIYVRTFVAGVLVVALTFIFGTDYNGAGMGVVGTVMAGGTVAVYAFLLKILFTARTLGAGYKGGEIVPAMFIGATFGCAVSGILGLDSAFARAIGLVCVFCGAVNAPLASIVLAVEMFGGSTIGYFALAVAFTFVISGKTSLYSVQKNVFSRMVCQKDDEIETI